MGGAKNWSKAYEERGKIRWTHYGDFDFVLYADKKNGKWILSLSTPNWPQKYNKKIVETDTKKRIKSFAYDWRKSNTETKDLLKETGIWVDNTRRIFNPFNVSLALMNFFLFLALVQTWNFIGPVFGDIFLGIIMGAGGLIFLVEGFYHNNSFNIRAPIRHAEETVSLLTGIFAVLSSYGYVSGSQFYVTHFSGVQGGIFAFMFAYLVVHWLKNRILRSTYLLIQGIRNRLSRWKEKTVRTIGKPLMDV